MQLSRVLGHRDCGLKKILAAPAASHVAEFSEYHLLMIKQTFNNYHFHYSTIVLHFSMKEMQVVRVTPLLLVHLFKIITIPGPLIQFF